MSYHKYRVRVSRRDKKRKVNRSGLIIFTETTNMPPHLIKPEPCRKWKKDKWKSLPPACLRLIKFNRDVRIRKLEWITFNSGINAIYPSDDDDLEMKVKPD